MCNSYIGMSWEQSGRRWQMLRRYGGEYRKACRILVWRDRASDVVCTAVARWMGGSEVEDGRLPCWEEME
jgi:hypothetical protein